MVDSVFVDETLTCRTCYWSSFRWSLIAIFGSGQIFTVVFCDHNFWILIQGLRSVHFHIVPSRFRL